MGFQLICKTAFFIFVVATILVEDTLTKSFAQDDDSTLFEWGIGILDTLTNDSCVDDLPFPDLDDPKWFYQCFVIDPSTNNNSYVIEHLPCSRGGYFDTTRGDCFPILPFNCTVEGTFADPIDCIKYNRCVIFGTALRKYVYTCNDGEYFAQVNGTCIPGSCGTTPAPSSPTPSTPEMSTTASTTTVPTTTPPPFQCGTTEGLFPEPSNCTQYNRCILIAGSMRIYTYTCPADSYFDQGKKLCVTGSCLPSPPPTTTTTSTTTPEPTTPGPFQCGTTEGLFPEATDCTKYIRCIIIAGSMRLHTNTCPVESYFDQVQKLCVTGSC